MAEKLTAAEIERRLHSLSGWTVNAQGELTRTFKQPNFMTGLLFVNRIGGAAEAAEHHPDVLLTYPSVKITLITHDAGGLTAKDFDLAAQIDKLA
ncbi:MAG: 4a-hydroxytetrahydrobiopterin dehydratase [Aggregatilineales bacterium]